MKKPVIIEISIWSIVLCVLFCTLIFGYSKLFVEPNIYTIAFKDIDGITKGSPVRFMGINVGYVRNLKSKDKFINVQIIVTKKDMKIPNGTVARVEFYGLGGSKSVELMPPDGSCDVGILTGDTIRINDVVKEAQGLVEIIEVIEKYVKGLNRSTMQKFLEGIKDVKDDKIKELDVEISTTGKNITKQVEDIKEKQNDMASKIKHANDNIEKINNFIKK